MQPGPCNMTRRQPRLRFLDKDCLRSARCCQQRGRPFQWAARILGPKVPHATIRGPWTSNRTSKLEARYSRHTQSRFGLLLHQLAVSSFHLAPPNDPDGPPFSPFSEEGPKESVSGVIEADDDDGGAPYFDGRPVPAAQVDIVPASGIQSRDMCNTPSRVESGFCRRRLEARRSNQRSVRPGRDAKKSIVPLQRP